MKRAAHRMVLALALIAMGCNQTQTDRRTKPSEDFFARAQPPLGEITVVRVGGESAHRRLLATTLQGIVNQSRVRIYLVGGGGTTEEETAQRFWLDEYAKRADLIVAEELGLDQTLTKFASEVQGYVLASDEEPWTANVGTTLAGIDDVLVAFEEDEAMLGALGLERTADLRGRWPSAEASIRETFDTLYPKANPTALGALDPSEHRLRDFLVQNRIFTAYSRPLTEGWNVFKDEVLGQTPADQPVFGYLSKNGIEELMAVNTISATGKFLVPTDTTPNLSVHSAMPATSEALPRPSPPADCNSSTLLVAVALSDGDNLAVPLDRYVSDRGWLSADRGKIAFGWSLSPALAYLAPVAARYYLETRSPGDEVVGMIGIGYASPTALPDPTHFLDRSFGALDALGISVLWEIDPGLRLTGAPAWDPIAERCRARGLPGVLYGYIDLGVRTFRTPGGLEVVTTESDYNDTPSDIGARIQSALAEWKANKRSNSMFVSAAVWQNDYQGLFEILGQLSTDPALMLTTPTELVACVARE